MAKCRRALAVRLQNNPAIWPLASRPTSPSGALVELLTSYAAGSTALQIVYPPSAVQPRRVRMLIEHVATALAQDSAA